MKPKEAKEKTAGEGFRSAYEGIANQEVRSKNGVYFWKVLRAIVDGLEKDGYKVTIEK